jgi:hypothetical protein
VPDSWLFIDWSLCYYQQRFNCRAAGVGKDLEEDSCGLS